MVLTKEQKADLLFAAFLSDYKGTDEDKSQQKPKAGLVGSELPPPPKYRLDGEPERGSTSSENQKPNRFFKPSSDGVDQDAVIRSKEQVMQRVAGDKEQEKKIGDYVAEVENFMDHNLRPSEKNFSAFLDDIFHNEKDIGTAQTYFLFVLQRLAPEYGTELICLCHHYHQEKFKEQSVKLYDQNCNLKGKT